MDSLTCAAITAQTLHAAGVRYVFGHPGGEVVDLIEALAGHGVEFMLTGHESAAAFMAGAMGRLTGLPGVCLATLGPGACNLVLGVGTVGAWLAQPELTVLAVPIDESLYAGLTY